MPNNCNSCVGIVDAATPNSCPKPVAGGMWVLGVIDNRVALTSSNYADFLNGTAVANTIGTPATTPLDFIDLKAISAGQYANILLNTSAFNDDAQGTAVKIDNGPAVPITKQTTWTVKLRKFVAAGATLTDGVDERALFNAIYNAGGCMHIFFLHTGTGEAYTWLSGSYNVSIPTLVNPEDLGAVSELMITFTKQSTAVDIPVPTTDLV